MNPIQIKQRIDSYLDMTRAGRFLFAEYNSFTNDVIRQFTLELLGDPQHANPENFQWVQQIRDDLYPLIKSYGPTLSAGPTFATPYYTTSSSTLNYPTDYFAFVSLNSVISGKTIYGRPTNYNELGPLLEDSFKHPSDTKIYYNDNSTGAIIYRGSTVPTSASLTYLKTPAVFSCGSETQLISAGGALTLSAPYYATEISVYNGTTYQVGATITGTGATLTSGQVILVSNTTDCDLPARTHEEIAKRAAAAMLLATANYPASQAVTSIEKQH